MFGWIHSRVKRGDIVVLFLYLFIYFLKLGSKRHSFEARSLKKILNAHGQKQRCFSQAFKKKYRTLRTQQLGAGQGFGHWELLSSRFCAHLGMHNHFPI